MGGNSAIRRTPARRSGMILAAAAALSLLAPSGATANGIRSPEVVKTLLEILGSQNGQSVMTMFLDNQVSGGWEIWLQVELAGILLGKIYKGQGSWNGVDFKREETYPDSKCNSKYDLFIEQGSDLPRIIGELKVQHKADTAAATLQLFKTDATKFSNCYESGERSKYVFVAAAVIKTADKDADKISVSTLQASLPSGIVYLYSLPDGKAVEQTKAGQKILAVFVSGQS